MKNLLKSSVPALFLLMVASITSMLLPVAQAGNQPEIVVYKSPTCGCCKKWVSHLEKNGFSVTSVDKTDMQSVKQDKGVPQHLASCHTAVVDGYVIEGHVPAKDIKKLLAERPQVKGLTVPGMPAGSPGMEQGPRMDPYDVLSFSEGAMPRVYSRYRN